MADCGTDSYYNCRSKNVKNANNPLWLFLFSWMTEGEAINGIHQLMGVWPQPSLANLQWCSLSDVARPPPASIFDDVLLR